MEDSGLDDGFLIRIAHDATDLAAWAAVKNQLMPHDPVTVDELQHDLAHDPSCKLSLATEGGQVIGSGIARRSRAAPDTLFAMARVVPEQRRRGIGSALLATLASEAQQRGLGHVLGRIEESDVESLAWANHRGLSEIGRDSTMILTLADVPDPPTPVLPTGVEIVSLADRSDLAAAAHRIESEAILDVPGPFPQAPVTFEAWMAANVELPGFLPAGSFVALLDDQPVGYAGLTRSDASLAEHLLTGVLRTARRRGIATAVKQAQIAWARNAGYKQLVTWTSSRNDPMRATNLKLGYAERPASIAVRGPLDGLKPEAQANAARVTR
jgi:mycothiol synthase